MEKMLTAEETRKRIDEMRGKRIKVLTHGGVTLVDAMGSDLKICEAARTTSGTEVNNKTDKENRGLIRYLKRHRHSTPVEFPVVDFLLEVPMDLWRQFIRHRTATVNEFSSRYSDVPDINDTIEADAWRMQSKSNRQGSSGEFVSAWPAGYQVVAIDENGDEVDEEENHGVWGVFRRIAADGPWRLQEKFFCQRHELTPGDYLSRREKGVHSTSRDAYDERLLFGVAKEVARKDLCLSTYTRARWQANLHNVSHLLGLRMDGHAQLEIRQVANAMFEILAYIFPVTMQAFLDYQLNAVTLSALDQWVVCKMIESAPAFMAARAKSNLPFSYSAPFPHELFVACQHPDWVEDEKNSERNECLAKLQALKLVKAS